MPNAKRDFTLYKYPEDTKRMLFYHGLFLFEGALVCFLAVWAIVNQWTEFFILGLFPILVQVSFLVAYDIPGYSDDFARA